MWYKKKTTPDEDFDVSILLLFAVERSLTARKVYEAMHDGLSIGFVENPMVLVKVQQFLTEPKMRERLERLIRESQN